MALIRRNPRLSAVLGMVLAGLTVTLILWPRTEARAQQTYSPLSAVAAAQISDLRRDAGLEDDALAATDATAEQLETVLAALRSWYDAHAADWLSARTAVTKQRGLIRRLESALDNGQDQASALASARQQLTQLQAAYETQLASLRSAALTSLSTDQQTLLTRMRSRAAVPMPYRILDLTGPQDQALTQLAVGYQQRLAVIRDAATQATLASQYAQDVNTALGPANTQLLASLAEYRGAAAQRLVAALQKVLPVEPEG